MNAGGAAGEGRTAHEGGTGGTARRDVAAAAPPPTSPRETYRTLAAEARAAAEAASAASVSLARARLVVFLAGVAAFTAARAGWLAEGTGARAADLFALAAFVTFVLLVRRHGRVRAEEAWQTELAAAAREAEARLDRCWAALPPVDASLPTDHPYADDLDVLGTASLAALLGGGATRPGTDTLVGWLARPAPPEVVRARQGAVRELADDPPFRLALLAEGRLARPVPGPQLERLVAWAESAPWLTPRRAPRLAARLVPLAWAVTITLHVQGAVGYLWIAPLLAALAVLRTHAGRVRDTLDRLTWGDADLRRYQSAIARIAARPSDDPTLRALADGLAEGGEPAPRGLARLFRLVEVSDVRFNGNLHVPLNLLLLWDVWVVEALERWQARNGRHLRRWLDTLGEVDALAALAGLAHAHPDWAFPRFDEAADRLSAEAIGHPLLPDDRCVRNDVHVGPAGRFLLVTGSNMSGKSTLLRAIGANVVLAGAGGPVCARELSLPPVDLHTSMRVRDSLAEGVSYFMAELQRLKRIVDAARLAQRGGGPTVLYLLDEILQGTNTAERQVAARRVIRILLGAHAIGAVTTHDLQLADAEDLRAAADAVHFGEHIGPGEGLDAIRFDYTLHPGIARSTNALELLRRVGIDPAD
ncbi:MAG: DNA mismatch repair protein MutS [Gemmatimonadetes bacterium]|nr:MAG: DNA mismatch repair protein MutS [Gemmatimonadota bacterium]